MKSQLRKKIKVDPLKDNDYNQFAGQFISEQENRQQPKEHIHKKQQHTGVHNVQQQRQHYKILLTQVLDGVKTHKFKKIATEKVKLETPCKQQPENTKNIKVQTNLKNNVQKKPNKKKIIEISPNWKQLQAELKISKNNNKSVSNFVAMDCQFVKCGQLDTLGRISIVDEKGTTLYDSFIRPQNKITDYITNITGITYAHIKNAPTWQKASKQVKKILMGKVIVGHTIEKDLEVCGLQNWKGYKYSVDIAKFKLYHGEGRKLESLKNLSNKFLGKSIQQGWHSSVQDAKATMQLFLKKKMAILKQFKKV